MKRVLEILITLKKTLLNADLSILAASLSYATVFSLVPILTIFLMISKWVGEFQTLIEQVKTVLLNFFAIGLSDEMVLSIEESLKSINPQTLGFIGVLGFLFSAIKIMYDFDKCLLKIWQVKKRMLFLRHLVIYIGILVLIPLSLIVLAAVLEVTYLNQILLGPSLWVEIILMTFLFLLFKFSPPTFIPWPVALFSTLITFLFLFIAQIIYIQAMTSLFRHNTYYGPIAIIPVFLLWIYFIWILILFGLSLMRSVLDSRT